MARRESADRQPEKTGIWRVLRVSVLLYVLAFVAIGGWLAGARTTDWNDTLYMAIYPVNGDGSTRSENYLKTLRPKDFRAIEIFLQREVLRYGIRLRDPISIEVGKPVGIPPPPPENGNPVLIALWSLQLRYFAWQAERTQELPSPDIRMFVLYYDPDGDARLSHSLGLRKGLIGVVHGFSGRAHAPVNNFIIAHEMLHTLGATDKYDLASNFPLFPIGYADPGKDPTFPQDLVEIMGGRKPVSNTLAIAPQSLSETIIGPWTAEELNWVEFIR